MKLELFKEACAILDDIPAEHWNLDVVRCGPVGCAMGWLGLHPRFRDLGLRTTKYHTLNLSGDGGNYLEVAMIVFDISEDQALSLFGPRHLSKYDSEMAISKYDPVMPQANDKVRYQSRVEAFLAEHSGGQL